MTAMAAMLVVMAMPSPLFIKSRNAFLSLREDMVADAKPIPDNASSKTGRDDRKLLGPMPTCWDTGLTDLCPARTSMDAQYTLELGHHLPAGLELAHPYPLPSLSSHKDPNKVLIDMWIQKKTYLEMEQLPQNIPDSRSITLDETALSERCWRRRLMRFGLPKLRRKKSRTFGEGTSQRDTGDILEPKLSLSTPRATLRKYSEQPALPVRFLGGNDPPLRSQTLLIRSARESALKSSALTAYQVLSGRAPVPRHTHEKTVSHPSNTYQCRKEQQAHFRSSVTDTSRPSLTPGPPVCSITAVAFTCCTATSAVSLKRKISAGFPHSYPWNGFLLPTDP
ncbi:Plasma Protease C1 Inhibitor [Manis pentadactyla]|nr:Plasma Protease C1 Inhibitor [Manis pentadactyla]